jgi:hypothetical protein
MIIESGTFFIFAYCVPNYSWGIFFKWIMYFIGVVIFCVHAENNVSHYVKFKDEE